MSSPASNKNGISKNNQKLRLMKLIKGTKINLAQKVGP